MPDPEHQFLTEDGEIPEGLDWDWTVHIEPHPPEDAHPLQISQDSWENALYYENEDFATLLANGVSDTFHERLHGRSLLAYQFHDPRLDSEDRIVVDGRVHPAYEDHKGDYTTHYDEILLKATLTVSLLDPHTKAAAKELLLTGGHTVENHLRLNNISPPES